MKKTPEHRANKTKLASASSLRLALENRLLFDGAVIATAEVVDDKAAQQADQAHAAGAADGGTSADFDFFNLGADDHGPAGADSPVALMLPDGGQAGEPTAPNLLIIDARCSNIPALLAKPPVDTDIRVLDPARDGYDQIQTILAERGETAHVQIEAAQQSGQPWLGSSPITGRISQSDTETLLNWGDHLAEQAQLTFHGLPDEVGHSGQTQAWLAEVHALTGAEVNWSADPAIHTDQPRAEVAATADTAATQPNTEQTHLAERTAELAAHSAQPITSLVFVDTTVKNYQTLLKQVDPSATVVILNPNQDGVDQIASALAGRTGIASIHLISHGADGKVFLGNGVLDNTSLTTRYASDMATIKAALTDSADILVYGCDVAQTASGKTFVDALAVATGADIAASTDLTGAKTLGANWVLEAQTGAIQADEIAATAWQGTLDAVALPAGQSFTGKGMDTKVVGNSELKQSTFNGVAGYVPSVAAGTGTTASFTLTANQSIEAVYVYWYGMSDDTKPPSGTVFGSSYSTVAEPTSNVSTTAPLTVSGTGLTATTLTATADRTFTETKAITGGTHTYQGRMMDITEEFTGLTRPTDGKYNLTLDVLGGIYENPRTTPFLVGLPQPNVTGVAAAAEPIRAWQMIVVYSDANAATASTVQVYDGLNMVDTTEVTTFSGFKTPPIVAPATGAASLTLTTLQGDTIGTKETAAAGPFSFNADFANGSTPSGTGNDFDIDTITGTIPAGTTSLTLTAGPGSTGPADNFLIATAVLKTEVVVPTIDLDNAKAGTGFTGTVDGVAQLTKLDATPAVSDGGENDITLMTIGVAGILNGSAETMSFTPTSGAPVVVDLSKAAPAFTLTVGGVTFNVTYDGSKFLVTNSAGGTLTPAALTAFMNAMQYKDAMTSTTRTAGDRIFAFTVTDNSGLVSNVAAATISVPPPQTDSDSDGVADVTDIDDDNDGILDSKEQITVTLDQVKQVPDGLYPGVPPTSSLRLQDISGQYVVDIFVGPRSSVGAPVKFDTFNKTIGSDGTNVDSNEVVELVYTTLNSPKPWNLGQININNIKSLTSPKDASGVRDAYAWSEPGTWTINSSSTSKAAVVSVNPGAADGVGSFLTNDTDTPLNNVINNIGKFTQALALDNTISNVLLNMAGPVDQHSVTFNFDQEQTQASMLLFNSGGANMLWQFNPVMTVFVPVNADGDTASDQVDLDTDNDGISDLYESTGGVGAALADANHDGTISLAEGGGDADKDGLMDIFDKDTTSASGVTSIGTVPLDSDTDTIADFRDLDSDGDGIADTIEARLTVGYAPNDGVAASPDTDKDGVLTYFDTNSIFGGTFVDPVNTDGTDKPDYLDTDSDNDTKLDSAESGLPAAGADNNKDGIGDGISGVTYANPDGNTTNPQTQFSNEVGTNAEVAYREVDLPPIIDLNGPASITDAARNNAVTYTENTAAVPVAPNADVSDLGNQDITKLSIVVVGLKDGVAEIVSIGGPAFPLNANNTAFVTVGGSVFTIIYSAATSTFTITNNTTAGAPMLEADLDALVQSITYGNASENPTAGDRTLTFTATDKANKNSASAIATITVKPVNDPPVAVDDAGAATEKGGTANATGGGNATGNVLTNDTDADTLKTSLTVSAIRTGNTEGSGTAGTVGTALVGQYGTLTIAANGSYTYVIDENNTTVQGLNAGQTLIDSFNYTVSDGGAAPNTDIGVLNITINGANDAPVAVADTGVAVEAGGVLNGTPGSDATGNVLANDTDVDTPAANFRVASYRTGATLGGGTAGTLGAALKGTFGSLTLNADGTYTYVVDNNNVTVQALRVGGTLTDTFNYTMNDGTAQISQALLAITIQGANDAPVAEDDNIIAAEDTPFNSTVSLVTNDITVDGPVKNAVAGTFTTTAGGTIVIQANGNYTYTPPANFDGVDTFDYTLTDGTLTDTATLTITVNPVNDAPAGTDKTIQGLLEDKDHQFSAADFGFSDLNDTPANDLQAVIIKTLPPVADGKLQLGGVDVTADQVIAASDLPQLFFVPTPGKSGTGLGAFTFAVQDDGGTANGGVDTDPTPNTIQFDILNVNDAPSGGGALLTISEDNARVIQVADFGFQDTGDTPANNFTNVIVDSLPAASEGTYSLGGAALTVGQVISVADISSSKLLFTPAPNFNSTLASGVAALGFLVQDDGGTANGGIDKAFSPAFIKFIINPVNDVVTIGNNLDGPVLNTDAQVKESDLATGTTAAGTGEVVNGSFTINNLPSLVSFTINGTGLPPSTPITLARLQNLTGQNISIPTANGELFLTGFNSATASVSYTYVLHFPATNNTGAFKDVLTFKFTDVDLDVPNAGTLGILIEDDKPVAANDANTIAEDGPATVTGSVMTNDNIGADGAAAAGPVTGVAVGATGTPAPGNVGKTLIGNYGTIVIKTDGSYTYTIDNADTDVNALKAGQTLVDSFVYKITDKDGSVTGTTTLAITINGANDNPLAVDDGPVVTAANAPVSGNVITPVNPLDQADTDPEGDTLTVTSFTLDGIATPFNASDTATIPNVGTLIINTDGSYTFTPDAAYHGPVPVATYILSDGNGGTARATLSFTDVPNQPPVANDDGPIPTTALAGATGNVLTNDSDPNGDPQTVTGFTIAGIATPFNAGDTATIPNVGTLVINADGSFTFTPLATYHGSVPTATYSISDGQGGADTADLSFIDVPNQTPDAVNDGPVTAAAVTGASGNVSDNDTDPNNDPLTVTGFTIAGVTGNFAAGVTATISGVGTLQINADGSFTFTPLATYHGAVPVATYSISDGQGGTDTATLSFTDVPNQAPDAVNDGPIATTAVTGATGNVLDNDTDPNNDLLTVFPASPSRA